VARLYTNFITVVEYICLFLMCTMTIVVAAGVVSRYLLDAALSWYDEFAEYILVWTMFYGAVLASHHRAHIGFETLVESLPLPLKKGFEFVTELLLLGLQGVILYYGWILLQAIQFETAISLPWVKMTWVYSVIPVSAAMMLIVGLRNMFTIFGKTHEG
jgi:TRAP-type C4-dicarboxylate transport system permease small subunit